jgi:hypothetical protein
VWLPMALEDVVENCHLFLRNERGQATFPHSFSTLFLGIPVAHVLIIN